MSLRKPPALTRALLAANRRNALKSTGPRSAQGKAWARRNGLRTGSRSRFCPELWSALFYVLACSEDRAAQAVLPAELRSHPVFSEVVNLFRQAEIDVVMELRAESGKYKKDVNSYARSRKALYYQHGQWTLPICCWYTKGYRIFDKIFGINMLRSCGPQEGRCSCGRQAGVRAGRWARPAFRCHQAIRAAVKVGTHLAARACPTSAPWSLAPSALPRPVQASQPGPA